MQLGGVLNVIIEGRGDATTRHPWSNNPWWAGGKVEGGRRRGLNEYDNGRKRRRHNQQPLVDPASSLVFIHTTPFDHDQMRF